MYIVGVALEGILSSRKVKCRHKNKESKVGDIYSREPFHIFEDSIQGLNVKFVCLLS